MRPGAQRGLLTCALVWMTLCCAAGAGATEVYVIGNAQHPWEDMGTLVSIDATTDPGWIQPRRTEPTENLSLDALGRGGDMTTPQPSVRHAGDLKAMIDGDPGTAFDGSKARQVGGNMDLDLGETFGGVERIVFYPSPAFGDKFLRGYEVYINDGSAESRVGGTLQWDLVEKVEKNSDSTVRVRISSQYVRHIRIVFTTTLPWEIAELEIYSRGFVPRATYTSNVIDLGDLANFGHLRWSAEQQEQAEVRIFTRTGATEEPYLYYEIDRGERIPVSKRDYDGLDESAREKVLDAENWRAWSSQYTAASGEPIAAAEPRRYIQFKCEFFSSFFTEGARIDSLAFEYSTPPVARFIAAEISPTEVLPGKLTTFRYAVRARVESQDTGFDALGIATPTRAVVRELKIGDTQVENFTQDVRDDQLIIRFPDHRILDTTPLELTFDTAVLVFGTRFEGWAFDTLSDELPQPFLAGNASPQLESDDLSVAVSLDDDIVQAVVAVPNPFTPNGDGSNDRAQIQYQILKLTKGVPVAVSIYDLAGGRVRDLHNGVEESGIYSVVWDGLDDAGQLVAPGIYLGCVEIDADTGSGDSVVLIAVVY
jgi:hypothetical protein